MKKVFLGVCMVVAMFISLGVTAEGNKGKKETPKAETTKVETKKAEAKSEAAGCCAAAKATCCSAVTTSATCCSGQSVDVKNNEKKDCTQIEKQISEKKSEAKQKK